jgi:hypothetical protein
MTPLSVVRNCAICGSTKNLQEHHLGGQHHASYFTIPLCESHHLPVTKAITAANAETMLATSDREERLRRARLAALVFLWFLDQCVKEESKT